RVTAHGGFGPVRVIEGHANPVMLWSQDDQAISPDAVSAIAKGLNALRRPLRWSSQTTVEHDKVVSGASHFIESQCHGSLPGDGYGDQGAGGRSVNHSFPKRERSLSHQTIQTASRTIPLFILLCPSIRSVNTIGI